MNILIDLFLTFAKIGLFTFGGGYAMISIVEDICVNRKKWITHDEMMNLTIVAESTPGPVAVNCATFVGYKKAGVFGSVVATIAMVLPSFIIIYIISVFLNRFLEITIIANAFKGIKIAVGFLIIKTALGMIKKINKDVLSIIILVLSCGVMIGVDFFSLHFSSVALLLAAGGAGIIICSAKDLINYAGGKKK